MADPPAAPPPPTPGPRARFLSFVGGLLALAALAWTVHALVGQADAIRDSLSARLAAGLVTAGLLYGALGILMTLAWWWLCGVHGDRPPVLATAGVWGRTQLAKYLPGNVFHYVSRQWQGRRLGLRHETLVASHLLELLSLLLAAALWAVVSRFGDVTTGAALGGGTADGTATGSSARWLVFVGLAVLALVAWPWLDRLARRIPGLGRRLRGLPHLGFPDLLRRVGPALLLHAAFFLGTGSLLQLLDRAWNDVGLPWPRTVGLYAVAWAAGLVTPGAPGGLGIREAVLTLELGRVAGVDPGYAAMLALGLRLVTVLGDVFLYLAAAPVPLPDPGAAGTPPARGSGR